MQYIMMVGERPTDLPFTTFLIWQDSVEDYFESQIEMQRAAIEEALANFWNEIN